VTEKRDRYYTVGGSGTLDDFTAIALFQGNNGKRDAVIGVKLKEKLEVSGYIHFIAKKFGIDQKYEVAMVELPMIYWKGGGLEEEVLVMQAINEWVVSGEDPSESFYDNLEDYDFQSFYSDYNDAVNYPRVTKKQRDKVLRRSGKGFG
jgi:hypothetical protein